MPRCKVFNGYLDRTLPPKYFHQLNMSAHNRRLRDLLARTETDRIYLRERKLLDFQSRTIKGRDPGEGCRA